MADDGVAFVARNAFAGAERGGDAGIGGNVAAHREAFGKQAVVVADAGFGDAPVRRIQRSVRVAAARKQDDGGA